MKEKKASNVKQINEEDKKKRNIIKIIIIVIIFLLIAILGTLYENNEEVKDFFDKYIFRKDIEENNLPSILTEGENEVNAYSYNGKVITLSKNVLSAYNEYATAEYTLDIEITNPIFASAGKYLCIAEREGQRIYLISGENILWQKKLEGEISHISINKHGYIAVSVTGQSYKTIVEVFDTEGNGLFNMFLSSTYVIDTSITPDNKYLAIAEADFSGIMVQSNIKIVSIEKAMAERKDSIEHTYTAIEGDLIVNIGYDSENILSCIYDDKITKIKDFTEKEIANFENENVMFADLNNDIIKVVKLENKDIDLQIINAKTEKVTSYIIEEPKSIYSYENVTAINLGTEVLFINNNGWLIKRYKSSQEINNIVLSNDIAGIVYSNKIELISL